MESAELERWRRVQELFEGAADLRPGEQAAYLVAACGGDGGLRQEVEALLRSDAEAGSFIEHAIRRGSDLLLAAEPDPLEALGKIGKYEILGRIGEGGFGIVYKGRDAVLQRYVAVKTCSSSDEKLRRRFFREGQIAAGLQHPNITTVHDLGVERGIPYLVQEFLAGEDLNHKIARQEGLTALRRLEILVQVARGLEYAHLQGVLHRDIKPANIRILPSGTVKIMDFGIAKLLHEVSDVTTRGVTLGTVGYLAPEQLRGEEVDRRTDIFSFGVLVYELLTYQRPFPGSTFSEVSYRLLNEEPAALGDLAPVHGRTIAELARRCLAKDPANRYESFAEVIAVLEPEIAALRSGPLPAMAAAAGSAASSVPAEPSSGGRMLAAGAVGAGAEGRAADQGRRRRRLARRAWLGAAAAALAVSLGAAGWAVLRRQAPGPAVGSPGSGIAAVPARQITTAAPEPANAAGAPRKTPDRSGAAAAPGVPADRMEPPPAAGTTTTRAAAPGAPRAQASASSAPARQDRRQAQLAAPALPAPPGSRRAAPMASRPGGGAGAGAASGTGGEAAPRGDAEAAQPGQDGGVRGERQRGATAATAEEEDETAGAPPGAGAPAEDSRRGPGPASAGGGPGAESAGEAGGAMRPMVRGDVIPPGAPRSTPPRLLSRPEPQYPDRARRRQVESDVLLLVLVDENGRVIRAIVKRTDDIAKLGFNEAARRAAFRATFNPASRDGLPGKMWTELPFSFRLHPGE